MNKISSVLLCVILSCVLVLTGCGISDDSIQSKSNTSISNITNTTNTSNNTKGEEKKAENASYGTYNGKPYEVVGDNEPFFSDADKQRTDAFESYSSLDYLGRCGVAYANICSEIMPTEKRGEIGFIRPSGWHTANYHELVDGNYLYNRCHLIGYQLAGENANEKNLITGTRYLNVEGMLPFENKVSDYVKATNHHVLYRVTPIFEGNNLVASGVLMEAYSVEDNGRGVRFCVYCYNVQPGIDIDYATGNSKVSEVTQQSTNEVTNSSVANNGLTSNDNVTSDYVLNKNTKVFHKPDCSSVSKMKEKNKEYFKGSRQEAIDKGYSPCGNCHP